MMPVPTLAFRLFHIDNLDVVLRRGGFHAPNCTPQDGLTYRPIHNTSIQMTRRITTVPCGPGGVVHDYVPFYFGPRSPMLLQLHTGQVAGYSERQYPLIYAVTSVEALVAANAAFVFTDGHAVRPFTRWFDSTEGLQSVDWAAAYAHRWNDTLEDGDRKRRKQAELLVHRFCPWQAIERIGVVDATRKAQAEDILQHASPSLHRVVEVRKEWYY